MQSKSNHGDFPVIDSKNIYAPIANFYMRVDAFTFTNYLQIKRFDYPLTDQNRSFHVSGYEQIMVRAAKNCFIIGPSIPKDITVSELINTMLLSFWIHGPTKAHVAFRFGPNNKFSKRCLLIAPIEELQNV